MNDLERAAAWISLLAAGLAAVAIAHHAGLPRTYARDLLHVGAGVWVWGWPGWSGRLAPLLIVWGALAAAAAVPFAVSSSRLIRRVHDSVAGEGERWSGIVAYTGSFAVLTTLALAGNLIAPAACAAAALCLGDGLGGLVGRRFGRRRYSIPWSKSKTWEGTLAVAVCSALGAALALAVLGFPVRWGPVALLGLASAAAEGLAPRAWDNAIVPAAVLLLAWCLL